MTTIPSGLGATLGLGLEATWNATAADWAAPTIWLPFESSGMELKKTTIQSPALIGQRYELRSRRRLVELMASGPFNLEVTAQQCGGLLALMLAAAGNVTPTDLSGGAYQQVYQPGVDVGGENSCNLQIAAPTDAGVLEPFSYTGAKCSEWEISCARASYAQINMTLDAYQEETSQEYATPSYVPSQILSFVDASLIVGATISETDGVLSYADGTTIATGTSFSVKGDNALAVDRFFFGQIHKAEQIPNAFSKGTGQVELEFRNLTDVYDAFAADTPTTLVFTLASSVEIEASGFFPTLQIIVPAVFFEGDTPKIPGPDILKQTAAFTYLQDDVDGFPAIQFAYTSADSAVWP